MENQRGNKSLGIPPPPSPLLCCYQTNMGPWKREQESVKVYVFVPVCRLLFFFFYLGRSQPHKYMGREDFFFLQEWILLCTLAFYSHEHANAHIKTIVKQAPLARPPTVDLYTQPLPVNKSGEAA